MGGWNLYGYPLDPVLGMDPLGLIVIVTAKDAKEAKILKDAYARLKKTKRGKEITAPLEKSKDRYTINSVYHDAYYCPFGTKAKKCNGKERAVFIDPNNTILLPTTNGMEPI